MAVSNNGFALRRRWFFLLTLLAFGLALGAGGILWHSVETSSVVAVQTRIDALKPLLTGIRVSADCPGGHGLAMVVNAPSTLGAAG